MKGWKKRCLQGCNGLLGSLLAMMGFSACEKDLIITPMYGAISTNYAYTIKGIVTNEADEPLPNIRIRSPYEGTEYADTLYTDGQGEFLYRTPEARGETFPLLFEDIDGEANNGTYASDSVSVSFEGVEADDEEGLTQEITVQLKKQASNE